MDATVANTIWSQVSMGTKMAVGARQGTYDEKSVTFKVTNSPHRYIEVEYRSGSDDYKVTYFRLKRSDYSRITLGSFEGVYCENLDSVIYDAVNQ